MALDYCLHGLLQASFQRFSQRVAIRQEGRSITYAELDAAADRAAALLDGEDFVGVTSAVTIESIAAIIGILRAGAAYVPLDVLSPPARLEGIIADAGIRVAFVDRLAYPEP